MIPTIATRFRCRRPLTDLTQLTLMFLTLILQYLNELVERKVGDFTSPKAFHTVKVQRFNRNCIKLLTKFTCELPLKIFALVTDFPIEPCELSDTPPPAIRTFDLTRKFFVERPKFVQGVFQGLGVLFFLTRAKCQISVFHTKVCPNALTCCWQWFKIRVGCDDTEPIVSAIITFDCNTTESPVPLAVFMERIRHLIKLPLTRMRIPFAESQRDTIVFQRPPRVSGKGDRFELMSRLDMRSATKFLKKSVIRQVNPFELFLNGLTWQRIPMRVGRLFQIRQVSRQGVVIRIRQSVFIPLALPLMEILVDLPHIIKQVTNPYYVRLFSKRVFIGLHGISVIRLYPLTSGRQARNQEVTLVMLANGYFNYTTF